MEKIDQVPLWSMEGDVESPKINQALSFLSKELERFKGLKEKINNDPDGVALISGLTALGSIIVMATTKPGGWKMAVGEILVAAGMLGALAVKIHEVLKNNH